MKQVRVELAGLSKQFSTIRGTVDVLKGISLTVEPGELFVLLGPSGCGKSTLLNLVAGLEKPTGGTIRIGERVVADPSGGVFLMPFERDVAMVFQSYALYPHMTVEKNIAFPLSNLKEKLPPEEVATKVRKAAELLKIDTLLDRKPSELSGGQRQRVAIGRALVREPLVFLLDEPLSNLDAQLRTDMRAQLKALQRRLGITALYVTHDQVEAMTLGDRIAIVNGGKIEQMGTPVEIYDSPATPFVARFIGSPPMNVLEGTCEGGTLRVGILTVTLPDRTAAQLRGAGTTTIGIRPEHITLGAPGSGNCDLDIEVVENIGGEYLVYLVSGDTRLVARAKQAPQGTTVAVVFDPERIRVYRRRLVTQYQPPRRHRPRPWMADILVRLPVSRGRRPPGRLGAGQRDARALAATSLVLRARGTAGVVRPSGGSARAGHAVCRRTGQHRREPCALLRASALGVALPQPPVRPRLPGGGARYGGGAVRRDLPLSSRAVGESRAERAHGVFD